MSCGLNFKSSDESTTRRRESSEGLGAIFLAHRVARMPRTRGMNDLFSVAAGMGVREQRLADHGAERLLRRRNLRRPDLRLDRRQVRQDPGLGWRQRHRLPGRRGHRVGGKLLGVRAVPILRGLRLRQLLHHDVYIRYVCDVCDVSESSAKTPQLEVNQSTSVLTPQVQFIAGTISSSEVCLR